MKHNNLNLLENADMTFVDLNAELNTEQVKFLQERYGIDEVHSLDYDRYMEIYDELCDIGADEICIAYDYAVKTGEPECRSELGDIAISLVIFMGNQFIEGGRRFEHDPDDENSIPLGDQELYLEDDFEDEFGNELYFEMGDRNKTTISMTNRFQNNLDNDMKLTFDEVESLCDHFYVTARQDGSPVSGTNGCCKLYWKHPHKPDIGAQRGIRVINRYLEIFGETDKGTPVTFGMTVLIMCYDKDHKSTLTDSDKKYMRIAVDKYSNIAMPMFLRQRIAQLNQEENPHGKKHL